MLSRLAQMRRGFTVQKLPELSAVSDNPLTDALADNTMTPVDEQAMFRIDFPSWLRSRSDRDRRIVWDLMMGERTSAVSRKYAVTAARISQLRRQFCDDWTWYCGETISDAPIETMAGLGPGRTVPMQTARSSLHRPSFAR